MLPDHVLEGLRARLLPAGFEMAVVVPLWPGGPGEPALVSVGDAVSVRVAPAEVLRCVLRQGAPSYALVHTHPDGGPPSAADLAVTRRLVAASLVCGVRMHASVVLTETEIFDCIVEAGGSAAAPVVAARQGRSGGPCGLLLADAAG